MTTSMQTLLTNCAYAMGDPISATWNRTTVLLPWCNEAMLAFPILRPMQQTITVASVSTHIGLLNGDFREIISVIYTEVSQDAQPTYLTRKNHHDPQFFDEDTYYDIDRDYLTNKGWLVWFSKAMLFGEKITINYLANHKTDCTDAGNSYITIPDNYVNIIIAYVVMKGARERLSNYMRDPTAYTAIITQMSVMVQRAEDYYNALVDAAVSKYIDSKVSPKLTADKFDRVY